MFTIRKNKLTRQNSLDRSSAATDHDPHVRRGSSIGEKLVGNLKRPFLRKSRSSSGRRVSSCEKSDDVSKSIDYSLDPNVFVVKKRNAAENWFDSDGSHVRELSLSDRRSSTFTQYAADNVVIWDPSNDKLVENEKFIHQESLPPLAQPPNEFNQLDNFLDPKDARDVLSQSIFEIDKDINLHILTKFVSPSLLLQEEQNVWTLDYLLTAVNDDFSICKILQ